MAQVKLSLEEINEGIIYNEDGIIIMKDPIITPFFKEATDTIELFELYIFLSKNSGTVENTIIDFIEEYSRKNVKVHLYVSHLFKNDSLWISNIENYCLSILNKSVDYTLVYYLKNVNVNLSNHRKVILFPYRPGYVSSYAYSYTTWIHEFVSEFDGMRANELFTDDNKGMALVGKQYIICKNNHIFVDYYPWEKIRLDKIKPGHHVHVYMSEFGDKNDPRKFADFIRECQQRSHRKVVIHLSKLKSEKYYPRIKDALYGKSRAKIFIENKAYSAGFKFDDTKRRLDVWTQPNIQMRLDQGIGDKKE